MGIKAAPEIKFQLINDAIMTDNNMLNISQLCKIAGVSRSGFYAWKKAEPSRSCKEEKDRQDFEIILTAYRFRGYSKGARGIHMRLLHLNPPIRMNVKKIRRLMKKYNLKCPIRKANPYRRMAAAMKTSNYAPNLVNRDFISKGPRKVLLTDITYLFYSTDRCYLSTILDAATHEVLAYKVSQSLQIDFVLNTLDMCVDAYGSVLDDTTIVHSDQGCHYTSNAFVEKLRDDGFIQSMSRRGNCWDNAPQESFFGHMKDDIARLIASVESYEEVLFLVDDWIDYYNNDRYQWELLKLSPVEYYKYLTTGYYPIPIYEKPKN